MFCYIYPFKSMEKEFVNLPLSAWMPAGDFPLVISGPCSAETRLQVMETARQLAAVPRVKVYRAGLWKPRSRPASFEGVGEIGLKWLQEARQETGLLLAVEVAHPKHVEACLTHHVDMLWLGARTVGNPFSVQALAETLKGVDIPVMVKNPPSPDLGLWLGALERMDKTGIRKLLAIHRGFFCNRPSAFRNQPLWEIPLQLKQLVHGLPVICDPSHICGRRDLLKRVSQDALDLGFDGLFIESHIDPVHALSDADQQLTPEALNKLLQALQLRRSDDYRVKARLEILLHELHQMDAEMLAMKSRKLKIAGELQQYEKEHIALKANKQTGS